MSSGSFTQQPRVQAVLHSCRRQIRNNVLLAGVASTGIVAITGILLAAGLDYLLPLPGPVRAVLLAGLVISVILVAYKSLLQPLSNRASDQQLGAAVDLAAPELQESLATLISIEGPNATSAEAGSDVMRQHLKRHVAQRISSSASSEIVDLSATRKRCGIAGLILCVAMVPVVMWPSISSLLLNRLIAPFDNLATVSNLYFEVEDANRTVARNSDVTIVAVPKWRNKKGDDLPENVQVQFTSSDGSTDQVPMLYDATNAAYLSVVTAISESVDFQISAPGVTTETFHLNVVDRPSIHTAIMIDTPPVYTGRAVQRFDGMLGDMEVFEGSQIEIELTLNKPVSTAALLWLDRDARPVTDDQLEELKHDEMTGEEVILLDQDPDAEQAPEVIDLAALPVRQNAEISPDGMTARFQFSAEAGGSFEFEIADEFELTNIVTTSRHLTVIYDQPPQLSVAGTKDGQHYRPNDVLPLNCLASDDIGLGELQLHYRIGDEVERIVSAKDFEAGSLLAQNAFRLALNDLAVNDGDIVRLKVKAADERPDPGPQVTWSDALSITIDSDANAAGAESLKEETEGMIAALKQLEKLLREDEKQGWDLRNKIRKEFSNENRAETERLSEKEQQQGRILEQIADQVASHPLMVDSAEKLRELSDDLRQAIPDKLAEAIDSERNEASRKVEDATRKIQQTRDQLAREIQNIEKAARLEQELAELNRLALQAEQLSKDSNQLDQDRQAENAKPDDVSDEEWSSQLQERQETLQRQQQDLTTDIEDLLRQQQELRKAAQNAQKEQLMELADEVQKLARQQSTVAQGTQEEARELGREAQNIANELDRVRRDTDKLNQQLDKLNDVPQKADTQKLREAIQELKKGNLDESRTDVADAVDDAKTLQQQLKDTQQADETAQAQEREHAAEKAQQIEERLKMIGDKIQSLQTEKNLHRSPDPAQSSEGSQQQPTTPSNSDENRAGGNSKKEQQDADETAPEEADNEQGAEDHPIDDPAESNETSHVKEILQQLKDAADAADRLSESTDNDPRASGNTRKAARESAERAEEGLDQAAAGRFREAAQRLSRASSSAQSAAQQMNNDAQQDQQAQAEMLGRDLQRLAENIEELQQDDASQIAAQQKTQGEVAQQASELPDRLQQLQDTLEIPALQMQDQAQKTQEASAAAEQAANTSQQATEDLQGGNLQQASQEGQDTAEQLRKVADAARQAGQQGGQQSSPVPNDVGQSVADALKQLQQAAEAMQQRPEQQSSESQPSDGSSSQDAPPGQQGEAGERQEGQSDSNQQGQPSHQPGDPGRPSPSDAKDGQPAPNGPPQSGSQPLSKAANSLAEAARQSLPAQHRPSDPSNTNSQASSDAGNGSGALWNGLTPNTSAAAGTGRNWGQLIDELDTNTSGAMGTTRDTEYEALIRMYFREVAKAAEKGK